MRILALLLFIMTSSVVVADDWERDEVSDALDEVTIARQERVIKELDSRLEDLEWDAQRARRERREAEERRRQRELNELFSNAGSRKSFPDDKPHRWWETD